MSPLLPVAGIERLNCGDSASADIPRLLFERQSQLQLLNSTATRGFIAHRSATAGSDVNRFQVAEKAEVFYRLRIWKVVQHQVTDEVAVAYLMRKKSFVAVCGHYRGIC